MACLRSISFVAFWYAVFLSSLADVERLQMTDTEESGAFYKRADTNRLRIKVIHHEEQDENHRNESRRASTSTVPREPRIKVIHHDETEENHPTESRRTSTSTQLLRQPPTKRPVGACAFDQGRVKHRPHKDRQQSFVVGTNDRMTVHVTNDLDTNNTVDVARKDTVKLNAGSDSISPARLTADYALYPAQDYVEKFQSRVQKVNESLHAIRNSEARYRKRRERLSVAASTRNSSTLPEESGVIGHWPILVVGNNGSVNEELVNAVNGAVATKHYVNVSSRVINGRTATLTLFTMAFLSIAVFCYVRFSSVRVLRRNGRDARDAEELEPLTRTPYTTQ